MEKIELTNEELERLKDDAYFKGVVVTKLKHIGEQLEQGERTISKLRKRSTWLSANVKIHWFLISVILLGILSLAWRVLGNAR